MWLCISCFGKLVQPTRCILPSTGEQLAYQARSIFATWLAASSVSSESSVGINNDVHRVISFSTAQDNTGPQQ